MASRSLTDRAASLRRLFSDAQFLTGRLTPGTLHLSLASPDGRHRESEETAIGLEELEQKPDRELLGLSREARARLPFLLFWPDERTLTATVTLPPSVTAKEREAVAGVEIESLLPWPLEEALLAFLPQKKNPSKIQLWAAHRPEISRLIARLGEAGLEPRWILPESLLYFIGEEGALAPSTGGLIHVDGHRVLCQIREGGAIAGVAAGRLFPAASPLERDQRILDLILSLAASGVALPERFAINLPVAAESPLFPLVLLRNPENLPPASRAFGLLSGLSREEQSALSFRKGSLAWQGETAERQSGIRILAVLSLFLVAVLVGDASAHLSRMDHRVARAKKALDTEARAALPGHRIVMPVEQLTQEKASLDRQRHLLSRGPDIIRLMKALTTAPPAGTSYELVSLSITRRFVTLSGKTDSFRSVDTLKKSFAATGLMHDISIMSAGLDIDRKTVTFRMRGHHD